MDTHEILAIVNLVFFTIGLPLAIYVAFKHGFSKRLGWFYLIALPVVRIIGSACTIALYQESNPSTSLYVAAAILSSIGLVPLLLCLLGLLMRLKDGADRTVVPERLFQPTHLLLLVGLALAIAGGVESSPGHSLSAVNTGYSLRKASGFVLLAALVVMWGMATAFHWRRCHVWVSDRHIATAAICSISFLFLRVIYSILLAFKVYNPTNPDVVAEGTMQTMPEFVVFILFVGAGLLVKDAPTAQQGVHKPNGAIGNGFARNGHGANGYTNGDTELGEYRHGV